MIRVQADTDTPGFAVFGVILTGPLFRCCRRARRLDRSDLAGMDEDKMRGTRAGGFKRLLDAYGDPGTPSGTAHAAAEREPA